MTTRRFRTPSSFSTDERVKNEFQLALTALRLTAPRFGGRPPEMQSVTAALWLWFSRLGRGEQERWLAGQFAELERFMAGGDSGAESAPAAPPGPDPHPAPHFEGGADPPPAKRRRRAGGAG